jgi:DNA-binding MarR family transcriptional regulator
MARLGVVFLTWKRHLQRGLAPHGITLKQLYVLRQLARREFLYPADIAEMLFADRPTVTVMLQGMAAKRWVVRETDLENRKRIRVRLTDAGRAKLDAVAHAESAPAGDPLAVLTEAERAELDRLLTRVHEGLRALTPPEGDADD